MRRTLSKLEQLTQVLRGHTTMLITMQDNPDPDSIASACALRKLANTLSEVQCSIAHGGTVGRAENRALVEYLGLNLRQIGQLDLSQFELFAMVDTQPGAGNNSLPSEIEPDIVIDHHPCRPLTRHCRFTDIRSRYGATGTILVEYLNAAKIKLEMSLATALLYAIRSDTQDLGRDTVHADIRAITHLYPLANKRMLSDIQRGKVERVYFQMLVDALKNARVIDHAIVTHLGEVENPDMIGEVADLLLREDSTEWVMVCGFFRDKMLLSLRTSRQDASADKVARHLVARKGTGGGHPSYAGGQLSLEGLTERQKAVLVKKIVERFVKKVGGDAAKAEPLIASKNSPIS
ncbi:MAG: DHH family phosphoesterase [Planctomycetaceae bacterium]|nr:DHH family phosphoesterase [Planctomycetaceae bacterium]